ncbi:MAG TPA: limonene-1,2-epoxide hydrolase family protein [Dehalococcoidia bacterium]|nr:limonene-1,2-epoxide hydrolase family protein [Dehalococcoidia bacterium]
MTRDNEQIVVDFCNAWEKVDLDLVMSFFSDDIIYHNMPMAPAEGTEAVREMINGFLSQTAASNWQIKSIATEGDAVLTERVDRFEMKDGKIIELPVMGTFELREGKIARWRDYFDLQTWVRQAQGG